MESPEPGSSVLCGPGLKGTAHTELGTEGAHKHLQGAPLKFWRETGRAGDKAVCLTRELNLLLKTIKMSFKKKKKKNPGNL